MAKKIVLGRGLDALLGGTSELSSEKKNSSIAYLNPDNICISPYQARMQVDEEGLEDLAASIKEHGVLQPVLVRPLGHDRYELVAGERRWKASQKAGLSKIPALIQDIDDQKAMALGLIENIQRENLDPIEEARGLWRLQEEFALSHEAIAHAVGRKRSSISNQLRLLKLPLPLQEAIKRGELEVGHGKVLLSLPEPLQESWGEKARQGGWSVRELERRLQVKSHPKKNKQSSSAISLQEDLSDCVSMKVILQENNKKGTGKVIFHYTSLDELQRLLQKIHFDGRG